MLSDTCCLHNQLRLCCLQSQKQLLDGLVGGQASTPLGGSPATNPAHAPYLLLFSLFVKSPTQWSASCHSLLSHCLRFTLSQAQPAGIAAAAAAGAGAAESSAVRLDRWKEASDEELWRCAFPMIRYFGLVHYLHDRLKGGSDDDWDARVRSRYALLTCPCLRLCMRHVHCDQQGAVTVYMCLHQVVLSCMPLGVVACA